MTLRRKRQRRPTHPGEFIREDFLPDYDLSVAVGVGFIALAGVAVEIGVVMLVYLEQAMQKRLDESKTQSRASGGVLRLSADRACGDLLRLRLEGPSATS